MKRILVTGGTGSLGRTLVPKLQHAGCQVRVLSRKPRPENTNPALEWAQADVLTGAGLAASAENVDVIIHGASSPSDNAYDVEVQGVQNVINAAAASGVPHLIYVSIVGIDRTPSDYYTAKLAAERVVETGSIPWTIVRGTQFHELIDWRMQNMTRTDPVVLDPHLRYQPIDVREFSDILVQAAAEPAQGLAPDFGGPEILEYSEILASWLQATQLQRTIQHQELAGENAAATRLGRNTNPDRRIGKITWRDWLTAHYPQP